MIGSLEVSVLFKVLASHLEGLLMEGGCLVGLVVISSLGRAFVDSGPPNLMIFRLKGVKHEVVARLIDVTKSRLWKFYHVFGSMQVAAKQGLLVLRNFRTSDRE